MTAFGSFFSLFTVLRQSVVSYFVCRLSWPGELLTNFFFFCLLLLLGTKVLGLQMCVTACDCLLGFQGSNSGCQACMASTFSH